MRAPPQHRMREQTPLTQPQTLATHRVAPAQMEAQQFSAAISGMWGGAWGKEGRAVEALA